MPYGNKINSFLDITVIEADFTKGILTFTKIAGSDHTIILRSDGNPIVASK